MKVLKIALKRILFLVFTCGWLQVFAVTEAQDVHLSFQERVLSAYALSAYNKPAAEKAQILARMAKYITSLTTTPVHNLSVRNFNEFLSHFRGEWPDSGDLETDLLRIESQPTKGFVAYSSPSSRVQSQIDRYLANHLNYFNRLSLSQLKDLTKIPMENLINTFENVAEKKFAEFNTIGTQIAAKSFDAIPDPLDRIRLKILFDQYYSLQALNNKKYIIIEMLGQKLNLTDMEKFTIMVQNSGPQFQKLLQVIIRQNGIPENLKQSFKGLEDSAKPVAWWQVEELLKKENGHYSFTYFERKPIGIGTMAQVHRAKIQINGRRQDVVVRFLKPGIARRVEEDHDILAKVAAQIDSDPEYRRLNGPRATPLMDDISKTVREELNMKATMSRQILAKTVYDKTALLIGPGYKTDIQFYVPQIFGAEKDSNLMVQELVIGRSLDKEAHLYSELSPSLKKSVIEEVAKLWINEVIFGSGFYHSDLHQGNFLVRMMDSKIMVTLLDFGMGGQIDGNLQRLMMLLNIAVEARNPELITDVYWRLSNQSGNQISRRTFAAHVEQRLKELNRKNQTADIFDWTGWAANEGLRLPYDFINMNRGLLIVSKSLEDAGSALTFTSIAKSLALKNPRKVLATIRSNPLVKFSDLVKMGWSMVQTPKNEKPVPQTPSAGLRCERVFNF